MNNSRYKLMFDSWGIDWKIEKFVIVQCLIKSNQKIPSELTAGFLSKEVQLIRDTIYARARVCVCVCVCVYDIMYGCTMYVCVREKEGERREGPKGMEKPIPSYQRKWLLADRKKCYAFSAEDDNNKHFTIGEL